MQGGKLFSLYARPKMVLFYEAAFPGILLTWSAL